MNKYLYKGVYMFGFGNKKKDENGEKTTKLEDAKKKREEEIKAKKLKKKEEERKVKEEAKKKAEFEKQQKEEKLRIQKEAKEQEAIKKRLESEREKQKKQAEKVKQKEQTEENKKLEEKKEKYAKKCAFKELEKKLIKMSNNSTVDEVQKRVKIKTGNVVEVDEKKYEISSEDFEKLKEMFEKEKTSEEIYLKLKAFDGKKCNLMVSNGKISNFFGKKLRTLDSTRWKFFYPIISDSYAEMNEYYHIGKNLYFTKMKRVSFEQGKFKYLKQLEQIDLFILGGDVEIPSEKTLVCIKENKIFITKEFVRKYVKETAIVPIRGKSTTSISGATKIDNSTGMEVGFWQMLIRKIKG
ncbi:nst1 [Ecytonucleospora hepatopenaei]|uniref:Nst1 n=1 Tax=Ecytonucleospora hepatopenaei TaxID=646526 RepID=A0A1W0E8I2_9MICR|nr:nst1 [Ecytonucleospora hepatopenaei]